MSPFIIRIPLYVALAVVVAGATGCPVQTWVKTYGGTGSEVAWDVVATVDGGYLVVGKSSSDGAGVDDVYVVKTTMDGGYIVAGHTESFGKGDQMYVLKLDSDGYLDIPVFLSLLGSGGPGRIF